MRRIYERQVKRLARSRLLSVLVVLLRLITSIILKLAHCIGVVSDSIKCARNAGVE